MLKKGKLLKIMIGLLVFSVLVTSCQAFGLGDQVPDEEALETIAAETLTAMQTQTEEAMPTDTPEPTPTPAPTDTPEPTPTADPGETEIDGEPYVVYNFAENVCQAGWESNVEENIPCPSEADFEEGFVQPVDFPTLEDGITYEEPAMLTYPDTGRGGYMVGRYPGLIIEEGDHFRATIGCQDGAESCDVRYTLRLIITGEGFHNIGSWREIYEGQVRNINVDLSNYAGTEVEIVLSAISVDATGEDYALWVNPRLVRNVPIVDVEPDEVYNFADNVCQAGWESSVEENIACPSEADFDQGFVQPIETPQLEDGLLYDEPAILTYPDFGRGGYMVGRYPYLQIEEGDHFRARIGCQDGAETCNVRFTLRAAIVGEGFDSLGSWHEVYDGQTYPIDVDLSDYAGMEISITLSAIAVDDTTDNYAIWVNPRIVRNEIDDVDPDTGMICNWASFVEDVTIEDREVFEANEDFTKIWRLQNIGNCTWTNDYEVVFAAGNRMGAQAVHTLPGNVAPGETVDIIVDMVAPGSPGTYTGYWLLRDEKGNNFGVGSDADSPFWVRIRVTEEDEVVIYNFAENVCAAGWESEVEDNIPCPSSEDYEQGFVQGLDSATLEDGNTYFEPTILTYPNDGEGGYMVGRYPGLVVQEGDSFRATIGCQFGAEDCNVRYTLRIIRTGEGFDRLGMWHEIYEGLFQPVDVDLSDFAGQEVEIVLSAIAADDTGENYAMWLDPRVVRKID